MKTARNFSSVFDAISNIVDNYYMTEDKWGYKSEGSIPRINISESEEQYEMEYAVPGMTKEDFKIQLDTKNNLVISTEETPQATTEKRYLRREFRIPAFNQSIVLPDDVNREAINARVENGILYIVLPKLKPEVVTPEVRNIDIV